MGAERGAVARRGRATARRGAMGRQKRLDMRVSEETKALLQHAADISDQSLTDYVLSRAREAAQREIRAHDVLTLSVRDSARFAELVMNPPEPNEHLMAAARRHDELIDTSQHERSLSR